MSIMEKCTMKEPNPGASCCYTCRAEQNVSNCPKYGGPVLGMIYLTNSLSIREKKEKEDYDVFIP
jgi:hypothetical protein